MSQGLLQTFLKKDSLKQRVLVPQHQALVSRSPMALLQILKMILMLLHRSLELFDVFRPPLAESGLGLPVPLLSFFRCSVYLQR